MSHALHAQGAMVGALPNGKANGRATSETSSTKATLINGTTQSEKEAPRKRPASNVEVGGAVRRRCSQRSLPP